MTAALDAAILGIACGLCYIGIALLVRAITERRRSHRPRCGRAARDGFGGVCSCALPARHRGAHLCRCGKEF